VATINGMNDSSSELAVAATVKTANPSFKGSAFSKENIAVILKAANFDFSNTKKNQNNNTFKGQTEDDNPLHVELDNLHKEIRRIVGKLYYKTKMDFTDIH